VRLNLRYPGRERLPSTIALQFIGCFALARTATAASIWLIFLSAGFDSLAAGLATLAFFLVALVVVALLAALALRLVLVAVLVAMFVFPCLRSAFRVGDVANVGHTVTSEGKPHPADSWQI
jgi:hypothetical protein